MAPPHAIPAEGFGLLRGKTGVVFGALDEHSLARFQRHTGQLGGAH